MITYNHENYIREAIEGVLMQVCNFYLELIVSNDCSTDSTDKVIQVIIQNHPKAVLIKYINHEKNLGMMPNFIETIEECNGKYIALCEGDDYWTDPLKLQKQVDFMEANPEYNICFHNTENFDQDKNKLIADSITRDVPETTNAEDLAKGNFIHTPSVVLRNNFILPKWFSKSPLGDWTLYMIAIKDKKIKKLDEVMAVYRIHNNSIWSLKSKEFRVLNFVESIKLLINSNIISENVNNVLLETMSNYKRQLPRKPYFFEQFIRKAKGYLNA